MLVDLSKSLTKILPISASESRPNWSVMIPCHNNASFLREAIESVLIQYPTDGQMQIVVVDDCSTIGDPEKIVRESGKGKVDFFRQPVNVGHSKNYDTCIKLAKGKLVHILHEDDRVRPGFYNGIGELFDKYPGIGAAFCRHIFIDESGNWISISEIEGRKGILDNWLERIAEKQRIQYCSIVVKREVYEALGGFINRDTAGDGWEMAGEDWEMWARIAAYYPVAYDPAPLAEYRIHKSSMTGYLSRSGQNIRDLQKVINIINKHIPDEKKDIVKKAGEKHFSNYAFETAKKLLEEPGNEEAAKAQLIEAAKMNPDLIHSNISPYIKLNQLIEVTGISVVVSNYGDHSRL
ncbi:MAG: glycosyltransferase, partial [Ignavibacteria bacterium]